MSSSSKYSFTQQIITLLTEKKIDPEQGLKSWWMTPSSKSGMRLTADGFEIFCRYQEFHTFETDDCLNKPRNLILLDRKMDCPYFIKRKSSHKFVLFIFGSQQAMMATLYGDIQKFLDSLSLQQSTS